MVLQQCQVMLPCAGRKARSCRRHFEPVHSFEKELTSDSVSSLMLIRCIGDEGIEE